MEGETKTTNPYLIPISIVLAGSFIALALYMSNGSTKTAQIENAGKNQPIAQAPQLSGSLDSIRPVTKEDHIKGNPDAPIKIVEYSDFECPFCKRFHDTMNEIVADDSNSDVAWVYRHFPLDQLHPVKARAVAVASECANEQGGNDAFWKFTDRYYALTKSNNQTVIETVIPQIVSEIGLDATAFQTCFESGKYDDHIDADIANAVETGGRGTPWSILIAPDGKPSPINGAQPTAAVQQLIESVR